MFKPEHRAMFTKMGRKVKYLSEPGLSLDGWNWYSVAFQHRTYPGLRCVMYSSSSDDWEWFGNLLIRDIGTRGNKTATIVAQYSKMFWGPKDRAMPDTTDIVLRNVSTLLGRPVVLSPDVVESEDGFMTEPLEECDPELYCAGFDFMSEHPDAI